MLLINSLCDLFIYEQIIYSLKSNWNVDISVTLHYSHTFTSFGLYEFFYNAKVSFYILQMVISDIIEHMHNKSLIIQVNGRHSRAGIHF